MSRARVFWQTCLAALLVAVTFLALHPRPPTALTSGWDKLNHALAFAALAWSGYLALAPSKHRRWSLIAALVAFGGVIELAQLVVPGRAGEWSDLFADSVGAVCGSLLAALFYRFSCGACAELPASAPG